MTAVPLTPQASTVSSRSAFSIFWARFSEDKAAVFGLGVLVFIFLLAIFGGPLASAISGHPVGHQYQSELNSFGIPKGITSKFWFGADAYGRDLFVETLYGARVSLFVGITATLIAVTVGLVVGLTAGFYGGGVDSVLSRGGDVLLALPQLLIAIGIVAACALQGCLGGIVQPGLAVVIFVISFFTFPYVARLVRGFTLTIRQRDFVEASRSLGASNTRIIFREVFPNLLGPIVVFTTLLIPQAILFEAALSYLGVGESGLEASWGALLNGATQNGNYQVAPWIMVFPGLLLVLTTLAFNLVGDGLRDALDVRTDR